jgi:hypothetical protein
MDIAIHVNDQLINLNAELGTMQWPDWHPLEIHRQARLAEVRGAMMWLRQGNVSRAQEIADGCAEETALLLECAR